MSVYLGLMSGTSLDGISAAAVRFTRTEQGRVDAELLAFLTQPYGEARAERLRRALVHGSASEYCRLAFDVGAWFADAAVAVLASAGVPRAEVVAIGSHGHTIWHEPPHATWQLGQAAVIAERTGLPVVSDFRVRDVAAGGQGAPLVPIADALLFSGSDWRALQNIGGIGNVTVVPPGGDADAARAFDTGPGVVVIDAVTRALIPELSYDLDGARAARGRPVASVLDECLAHPYFAADPPKSTGRELFGQAYIERFLTACRAAGAAAPDDVIATATALTARSIADAYRRFVPEPVAEVLVSGGGARNPTLVGMLRDALAPLPVRLFAEPYFDGDAKEAVAFAFLAYLHMNHETGNVPRATGARGPRLLGTLTPA